MDNDFSDRRSELHSKMNERHQARLKKYETKKQDEEKDVVKEEKSSFFALKFKEEHTRLTDMCAVDNISITDRTELSEYFDSMTTCLMRLQKFYNDSIAFLTSYEARKYQELINDLKQEIGNSRSTMIPKKKFAFKSRSRKTEAVATDNTALQAGMFL